jgi:hypothetical protein
VAGSERIILALGTLWETADPSVLAKRTELILTPGQNLVRISLMANVPDEAIMSGIEYIMQSYGEFNYAKAGGKMPAVFGNGAYDSGANFLSEFLQLLVRQIL